MHNSIKNATPEQRATARSPGHQHWIGGYTIRPRDLLSGTEETVRAELAQLARERGRGESLALHGDISAATGHLVVDHPRRFDDALEAISYDAGMYPAIAAALSPCDHDDDEPAPGWEDRAVERARAAGLFDPPTPVPASPDHADSGCPACGMSGWTPEQAERFAPHYMAALRSVPSHPIPDQPEAECWDCRRLRAGGHDPEALAARDLEEHGTPSSPRGAAS